tara:strand:- start:1262 stop:1795 length:534 start_codon:yes stop_codon:yes gene_type:complete
MRVNKRLKSVGKVILIIAACFFIFSQIVPSINSSGPKISKNSSKKTFEPSFIKEGIGYFLSNLGDTIAKFQIELAESNKDIQIGMMWRKKMSKDMGMLFLMPEEKIQSFWMKNTYLPLDIIYINSENRVVSVIDNAKPMSESPMPSKEPAIFILEISGGECAKLGIQPGNLWTWKRN